MRVARNPRYLVLFGHINDTKTIYGKTEELLMDYKSVEMMLRVVNPLKSIEWCSSLLRLNRRGCMNIQLFENQEDGSRVMKLLKITRN